MTRIKDNPFEIFDCFGLYDPLKGQFPFKIFDCFGLYGTDKGQFL